MFRSNDTKVTQEPNPATESSATEVIYEIEDLMRSNPIISRNNLSLKTFLNIYYLHCNMAIEIL